MRVERANRDGTLDNLFRFQFARQQVDRSPEVRRSGGRGSTRAAIEYRTANPLGRKKGPRGGRGAVGVVKWNAVKRHRVQTVREAAEISLAVTQADPVRIHAESPG